MMETSTRSTVVLVGELSARRLPTLRQALERSGFDVATCPGTAERACPALSGGTCPVAVPAAAAVVLQPSGPTSELPEICGQALGAPVLVIDEGSDAGPELGDGIARIGQARGPVAAVQALQALLSGSP
jgi:hypothetical protein